MARGHRDQRGRLPSTKRCPEAQNGGCSYCITGDQKRSARRAERRTKHDQIRQEA